MLLKKTQNKHNFYLFQNQGKTKIWKQVGVGLGFLTFKFYNSEVLNLPELKKTH